MLMYPTDGRTIHQGAFTWAAETQAILSFSYKDSCPGSPSSSRRTDALFVHSRLSSEKHLSSADRRRDKY